MSPAERLRVIGYGVSSVSVGLLGIVSWHSTQGKPLIRFALIGGMILSLVGMTLRWASHRVKKDAKDKS